MTREEAAKILSEIWYLTEKDAEAVDMAIKALKRPNYCWNCGADMKGEDDERKKSSNKGEIH